MGINTRVVFFYGIIFTHYEAENFYVCEDARQTDYDDPCEAWEALGEVVSPCYDCAPEYCHYILGKTFPTPLSANEMSEWLSNHQDYDAELRATCVKYNFQYSQPRFQSLVNVW